MFNTSDIAVLLNVSPGRVRQIIRSAQAEEGIAVPGSLAERRLMPAPTVGSWESRNRAWSEFSVFRWIPYLESATIVDAVERWCVASFSDDGELAMNLSGMLGTPLSASYGEYVRACVQRERDAVERAFSAATAPPVG